MNPTLGQFFKEARIHDGRALAEVASAVDLTPVELEEYESNIRDLPFDLVFALSNVLNIRPDEVLRLVLELTLPQEGSSKGRMARSKTS